MSDDLPEPFGPTIATCSPSEIESVIELRTVLRPRITLTLRKSISEEFEFEEDRGMVQAGEDAAESFNLYEISP
ncbi:MAG: hypothetical protein O2968_07105 [Acidobacteria bacterium]|nr:hypothetical protein [Acidobacteriota bacterium]